MGLLWLCLQVFVVGMGYYGLVGLFRSRFLGFKGGFACYCVALGVGRFLVYVRGDDCP